MSVKPSGVAGNLLSLTLSVLLVVTLAAPSTAQQIGRVEGTVVQADNGEPVGGVRVTVVCTNIATRMGTDGSFVLQRVPAGQHALLFRWLGFQAHQETVIIAAGATQRLDVRLQPQAMALGEVIVSTASRTPERVVEAPAAISGAAKAASVVIPTAGLAAAAAIPRAAAIPTRSPVKLPGPTVTAMRSSVAKSSVVSSRNRAIIGIRASAWPRAIA